MGKNSRRRKTGQVAIEHHARAAVHCNAAALVTKSPDLCAALSQGYDVYNQAIVTVHIRSGTAVNLPADDTVLMCQFISHIADCKEHNSQDSLNNALNMYRNGKILHRQQRADLIEDLRLCRFRPSILNGFLENIPTKHVHRQSISMPALNHWVCLDKPMAARWQKYLAKNDLKDVRKNRHPVLVIHPSAFQLVIKSTESVIIRDAATEELILFVYRGFCTDPLVLKAVDDIVVEAVGQRKTVRVSFLIDC